MTDNVNISHAQGVGSIRCINHPSQALIDRIHDIRAQYHISIEEYWSDGSFTESLIFIGDTESVESAVHECLQIESYAS
jgi:hypothetical protein